MLDASGRGSDDSLFFSGGISKSVCGALGTSKVCNGNDQADPWWSDQKEMPTVTKSIGEIEKDIQRPIKTNAKMIVGIKWSFFSSNHLLCFDKFPNSSQPKTQSTMSTNSECDITEVLLAERTRHLAGRRTSPARASRTTAIAVRGFHGFHGCSAQRARDGIDRGRWYGMAGWGLG